MRFRELLILLAGSLLAIFGLVIALGAMLNWSESEDRTGDLILAFGLGVLPLLIGGWMIVLAVRGGVRRRQEKTERAILHLAAGANGRLTPRHVAQHTRLTLEEAKAALDTMHLAGHCQTEVGDDGMMIYLFES